MTDHAPPPDTPRSRKIFWIKLLSLMALTLLAVFILFRFTAHRALNNRIQAVRDAGYPISPDELNAWYEMPEGKNAADVYLRAFAAFPLDPDTEGVPIVSTLNNFVLGQPLDEDMKTRIEDYLALHTQTIALIEQAAQIKETRFPLDLGEGYMLLLPHLSQLRRSARILQLQSILDADRSDYDSAAQRCNTILAIARSLQNEPILISSLVSNAINTLAYNQIEMLVATGNVSDDQLQALTKAIEPIDLNQMFLRAMVGERCSYHMIFNDSESLAELFPFDGAANHISFAVWRTLGLLDIDHSTSLDIMKSYIDFAENPTWPVPASLEDYDRIPRICVVSRQLTPGLSSSYKAFIRNEARRQTVLTAIAAERYRQQHNQFPTQLTDLVPEFLDAVPLDPFDNQPLRYRTEPTGVIIYSIGADGNDDGGQLFGPDGSQSYQPGNDIPFTFGGLQKLLWPQPEIEEEDWDDPYGMGGYGDYGDPDDFDEDEEPLKNETETTTAPQESDTTEEDMPH